MPQLRQLRAALTYDDRAVTRDLPDLVAFLMATGLRIGEACDLAWDAVDLDVGTIEVRVAAVRVRGQGVHREAARPSRTPTRHRRDRGSRPLFPAPLGGWRDPSNTQADLREAFAAAGFDRVTSDAFRKTVATRWTKPGSPPEQPPTSWATPTRR